METENQSKRKKKIITGIIIIIILAILLAVLSNKSQNQHPPEAQTTQTKELSQQEFQDLTSDHLEEAFTDLEEIETLP